MATFYSWLFLILAGLFEIGFTTCLKWSDGFSRFWPSMGFIASIGCSFWLLNKAIATIPLGTAYAVWTGIGVLGTVLVGIFVHGDTASAARLGFMTLLLIAIIGLKVSS